MPMTNERLNWLDRNPTHPDASLTLEELKEGWHWCDEFDFLLTQGEITDDEGVCICGFDRRLVK